MNNIHESLNSFRIEQTEEDFQIFFNGESKGRFSDLNLIEPTFIGKHLGIPPKTVLTEKLKFEPVCIADKILEEDPLTFVIKVANQRHVGDGAFIALSWLSLLSTRTGFRRLHLWSIGGSQKGKSDLFYTVAVLAPDDWIQIFPSISPKSLLYLTKNNPDALDGITLFFDEVKASEDAIPLLRTLTSHTKIKARHLTLDMQTKEKILDLRIQGKQTIWFTSVTPLKDEQLTERFLFINPDETEEQDSAVFDLQDTLYRKREKDTSNLSLHIEICKKIMQIIEENTSDVDVVIPYEINWPLKSNRSLYPLFCTIIQLATKVHFKQRKKDEKERLIATYADFQIARLLWDAIFPYQVSKISQKYLELLHTIPVGINQAKTTIELDGELQIGTRRIRYYAERLCELGLISSEKRDRRLYYWKRFTISSNSSLAPSLTSSSNLNNISLALSKLLASSASAKQAQNEHDSSKEATIDNDSEPTLNVGLNQKRSSKQAQTHHDDDAEENERERSKKVKSNK